MAKILVENIEDIGINVIRSFRLLRPLMGLKIFPAIRNILTAIGSAIVAIREITTIIVFLFIIYAIMGLEVSVIIICLLFTILLNF